MSVPVIVSFATPEYKNGLDRLQASCDRFGLHFEYTFMKSQGTWLSNVSEKPRLIRDAVRRWPYVLWLDADAEIVANPRELFHAKFDFCCNSRQRRKNEAVGVTGAYRTGTIAFQHGPLLMRMLDRWCDMRPTLQCGQEPLLRDAHMLFPVIHRLELPPEYLCVQGTKNWWLPDQPGKYDKIPDTAIIAHHRTTALSRSKS